MSLNDGATMRTAKGTPRVAQALLAKGSKTFRAIRAVAFSAYILRRRGVWISHRTAHTIRRREFASVLGGGCDVCGRHSASAREL
jgi:hypothetical protein